MKSFLPIALTLLFYAQLSFAQEHKAHEQHVQNPEHNEEHSQEHPHAKHMISVEIGHTHLSEGVRAGEKQWITVPSWAINYNYSLTDKWKVGLHTDIIIENFEVEAHGDSETIERSKPVSVVGIIGYKPLHHLGVGMGVGFEYAPEETFTVIRLGIEPGFPINHKWEAVFSMVYDIKIDAYNSWSMGVGFARIIGGK